MNGNQLNYINARKRVACDQEYWDILESWLQPQTLDSANGKIRDQRSDCDHARRVGGIDRHLTQLGA